MNYDTKWHRIKKRLAVVGKDADTVTVGKLRMPLGEVLEELASQYRGRHVFGRLGRTPKQRAKELRETLKALDGVEHHFDIFLSRSAYRFPEEARAARRALRAYTNKLRSTLDALANAESRSRDNASKSALRAYLLRLAKVCDEVAGAIEPRHRNQIVLACAAPVVGKLTIKNVRDFLSSKKTKTPI